MLTDRRLLILGLLATLGCAHASAPTDPAPTALLPLSEPHYALRDGGDSLVGMFQVTLDPTTLETTVTPIRGSSSQPPQGQ
ncbi:MAG: hypothetical protein ABI743_09745, partial [bacterium]